MICFAGARRRQTAAIQCERSSGLSHATKLSGRKQSIGTHDGGACHALYSPLRPHFQLPPPQVDRIKRNFSRYKIACPLAVIERGLSVPQDKSHADCLSLLPTTGCHLRIRDPFKEEKTTKKKGAAKKGKGKKK